MGDINNTKSILIIDDDEIQRQLASEALMLKGFKPLLADSGEKAVCLFEQSPPDMILLDVIMSGMDGFETCNTIRNMPGGESVPILMMTGLDDVESIDRAFEVGATDFITKPINYELLMYRIRYLLRARQVNDELVKREIELTSARMAAQMAHWEIDIATNEISISNELYHMFEIDKDIKVDFDRLLDCIHPDERGYVEYIINDAIKNKNAFNVEHRINTADGQKRIMHQQGEITQNSTRPEGIISVTVQDFTERREAEHNILKLAYYDNLTGLPNRKMLAERMEYALEAARRYSRPLAILSLDVDNFKRINDTLGRSAGDALIIELSNRLNSCMRQTDTIAMNDSAEKTNTHLDESDNLVARLGSDQIVIMLGELKRVEDAGAVAGRIYEYLEKPFDIDGKEIYVTVSIGISVFPDNGDEAETLLNNADAALHHAKDKGRNRFQFFSESINQHAHECLLLENNLRRAIEREELVLYYQPKVDIITRNTVGAEALIRWNHPEQGLLPPTKFISLAETSDMINHIGEWVLRSACMEAKRWQDSDMSSMSVAVNLSGKQFQDKSLPKTIEKILKETQLDPSRLELEITETILMDETGAAVSMIEDLKKLNVKISLDDFGTGFSSLGYLTQFTIDTLKIDRSFVTDVSEGCKEAAIIKAIIALAKSLDMNVIAEGVEQLSELTFLTQAGCNEIQGYYFSRPLPAGEFLYWVRANQSTAKTA